MLLAQTAQVHRVTGIMSSKTSEIKAGRIHKCTQSCKRIKQKSALKMMAVMQQKEPALPTEFLVTGRTGRRNAMPDILDPPHAGTTTAGLPERLQQLATSDPDEAQPSSSSLGSVEAKMDQHKDNNQQKSSNS